MMSTAAPPPYGQSRREARRAQRAGLRARQSGYPYLRRPSLVGPLVTIAIGTVLLLLEIGSLNRDAFLDWYFRWWPLLLIAIGLLWLGESWLDRHQAAYGQPSRGGLIVLVFVLACLGWSGRHAGEQLRFWSWHLSPENGHWGGHLFGEAHTRDEELDQPLAAGSTLSIRNPNGDVLLSSSSDGRLHVSAHNTVYAANDRSADRGLRTLVPQLQLAGNGAVLSVAETDGGSSDLTVQLPGGSSAVVNAGNGDVSADNLGGAAEITAGHGDVKLSSIRGNVVVHMSKGDLSARDLGGSFLVNGHADDVSLGSVHGPVTLDGEFFGDISLAKLDGPVSFHSSRTTFSLAQLPGSLSLDSGDLHLNDGSGPVEVAAGNKDIALSAVSGPVSIRNGDGDVSLQLNRASGDLQVENHNGDIELTAAPAAPFSLHAAAPNGSISSELPEVHAGDGDHTLSTEVGTGGPQVRLSTEHGDIELKSSTEVAAPSAAHTPAAAPAPGSNKAPHLRQPGSGAVQPSTQ